MRDIIIEQLSRIADLIEGEEMTEEDKIGLQKIKEAIFWLTYSSDLEE